MVEYELWVRLKNGNAAYDWTLVDFCESVGEANEWREENADRIAEYKIVRVEVVS
jgi:hypothetical protein